MDKAGSDKGSDKRRRRQGRPPDGETSVGRDAVLAAATALLRELPPAQVTVAAVARAAGVDPALVRYYFGSREALLLEVVQQLAEADQPDLLASEPTAALEEYIHRTFRFTRSAKYMQRLMVEELSGARSATIREQLQIWNRGPIEFYEKLRAQDGGAVLSDFNPLFLHLAVIGISDFFVSGQRLIELLASENDDPEQLARDYERFVVSLITDGLRKR
jgi:TetR/AcrR family transcriptional regulator